MIEIYTILFFYNFIYNMQFNIQEAQLLQRDRATRHDGKFVPRYTRHGS